MANTLEQSLLTARQMVAYMWGEPFGSVASSFVDDDNLPLPFCPMYPHARDLVADVENALPHQLTKIINRVRAEIEKTPVWVKAAEFVPELRVEDIQRLDAAKSDYREQAGSCEGETVDQWRDRAYSLLSAAKTDVPRTLLLLNGLITTTVAAMVSLATWDHKLNQEDIVECDIRVFGDNFPDGFDIKLDHFTDIKLDHFTELVLLSLDSSFRLKNRSAFAGIAITKAAAFSWSRDAGEEVELSVIRLSSFESLDPT